MDSGRLSDIEAFRNFLDTRIKAGHVTETPEDCLEQWRTSRQPSEDSLAAIREGLAEAKAGLGQPYREFLDELKRSEQTTENT